LYADVDDSPHARRIPSPASYTVPMATTLITGSNRGLGLELTRQYAEAGWRVHATCRNPESAPELAAVAAAHPSVEVHRLDVTQPDEVAAVATAVGGEAIDVLLLNAGVHEKVKRGFGETDYGEWANVHAINTMAPLRLTEAFANAVARSEQKRIVAFSTVVASIANNVNGRRYLYGSTKCALNYVVKSLSIDLRERGITILALHPGWVATDMGGSEAPLTPAESVTAIRALVDRLTPEDSGRYLQYDGEELPW